MFTRMTGKNVLMSFTGPFDAGILSLIGKNIENSITEDKKFNKTIFKVFIELAQNVSYYSLEKEITKKGEDAGVGVFILQDFPGYFYFILGNIIDKKHKALLSEKCQKINSYNREELRAYKRELRKLPPGEKGTGNIGLVQASLLAKSPLDYKFIKVNEEEEFYIIAIKINKN